MVHVELFMRHRAIKWNCRGCGQEIRAGLTYCRPCGNAARRKAAQKGARTRKRIAQARLPEIWACIACNQLNEAAELKCWRCGRHR